MHGMEKRHHQKINPKILTNYFSGLQSIDKTVTRIYKSHYSRFVFIFFGHEQNISRCYYF